MSDQRHLRLDLREGSDEDCHRPDLRVWIDEDRDKPTITLSVHALMGQQLRFVDLSAEEARALARMLAAKAAELDVINSRPRTVVESPKRKLEREIAATREWQEWPAS